MAAAAHERDFAMAELIEMTQSQFRGAPLIEHHVGDSLDLAMSGDDHHGQAEALLQNRVDQDETFDGAIHEQARILLDQIGLAAMARSQIEVPFFNEKLLDSRQNLRRIVVAEFGNQHAYRECLTLAQRSRKKAGAVIELCRGLGHAIACVLRNRSHARRIVQHQRDCGGRKVQVFAEGAKADGLPGMRLGRGFARFGMHSFCNTVGPIGDVFSMISCTRRDPPQRPEGRLSTNAKTNG